MRVFETCKALWERRAAARELDDLGPLGREELARDIGVPQELLTRAATARTGPPSELPRLMQALSLDPSAVERRYASVMRDMRVICACCADERRCREDLDRERTPSAIKGYCPNAETLDALRRDPTLTGRTF